MDQRLRFFEMRLRLQPRRRPQALNKLLTQGLEYHQLTSPSHLSSALLLLRPSLSLSLPSAPLYSLAPRSEVQQIATSPSPRRDFVCKPDGGHKPSDHPDDPKSNRPEQRTAIVARELARYKVAIARFSEQDQLEDVVTGYTFFWDAGVAFAIRNDIDWFDDNDAVISRAEEIQGYVFAAIKAVCSPTAKATAPLLIADGSTLFTEKTQNLLRWSKQFRSILNRPSPSPTPLIARLPQVETNADLDLELTLHENIKAVQQFSSEKTPGSNAIPAKIYKRRGPQLIDPLTALFQ
ncbi:hypothetical protein SprV_0501913500 [Sparganum proliferum]